MSSAPRVLRIATAVLLPFTLALALACHDPGGGDGRVLVLALDGLDPDAVAAWSADGGLPHLTRLAAEGAAGRLESEEPLLSPVVWTTVATGKPPHEHGIAHFTAVDPGSGERRPVTSLSRRVKAAWNIASEAGLPVAVVGWWATWPAETVHGQVVSDRVGYHFLAAEGWRGGGGPDRTHPPELLEHIEPLMVRPDELPAAELARFVDLPLPDLERRATLGEPLGHLRWAVATAIGHRNVGLHLWRREEPRLALVYVEAPDTVSHLFGAHARPGEPVPPDDPYGHAVEEAYRLADRIVGDALAAAGPDTTLVVLSDHGFALGEPPPAGADASHRQHRRHGVIRLWGRGVRAAAELRRPTPYDVLPTLLALLGLPAADDLPGRVLEEGLTLTPPTARVASYETPRVETADRRGAVADPEAERALLRRLESLGYAAGPPVADDGRLAAIAYRQGRHAEAERLYRRALAADPDDAALHASLGGVLAKLGREDEARAALEKALALDPDQPQALHNLRVLERRRPPG